MAETAEVRVNGFICKHASILALARQCGSDRPIEETVCGLARQKLDAVDDMMRAVDARWSPPPYDPLLVAQALGIRCIPVDDEGLDDAMVFVQNGEPTILYRQERAKVRTRFNIFHEIAHTLFPDYQEAIRYRRTGRTRLFDPDGQLEYLCNLAAAEFLMPMDLFWEDLVDKGFGASKVNALSRRYGASVEAVALRMVESNVENCAVALLVERKELSERAKKKKRRNQKHLELVLDNYDASDKNTRVYYSAQSDSFRAENVFIPKLMSVSKRHSCIYRAARSGELMAGEEELDLGRGRSQSFYIEALPVHSRRGRGAYTPVLVFLYPR